MQFRLCLLFLCFTGMTAHAQLNVQFLSNLDYDPILNDIWGYVDTSGTEYALVGMTTGLSIVSLADPTNPKEVQFVNGANSIWRDIKTWDHYAYVVADQGQDGLLIIDLSTLPADTAQYTFWHPNVGGLGVLQRSHNIWIDEFGLAYLAGSNIGGAVILDVHTDPWNPPNMWRNCRSITRMIFMPVTALSMLLRSMPEYLASMISQTSATFGSWGLSRRLFHLPTTPGCLTTVILVLRPMNAPTLLWHPMMFQIRQKSRSLTGSDTARTEGRGVIPHNVHVLNDYLIISYYTDGCIIVDASRPDNLIQVGNYDTYPGPDGDYNGSWGAYPFLPSGNILMSDRQNGLFVLAPHYVRGCYLEGTVRDAATQQPVQSAQVQILLEPDDSSEVLDPAFTNPQGSFKTGKAVPGTFSIRFFHPDYEELVIDTTFVNGVMVNLNINLVHKPVFPVSGRVVDAGSSGDAIPFAYVALQSTDRSYETQADGQGQYTFPEIIGDTYRLYAGNWGMYAISEKEVSGPLTDDIPVSSGYYDDFLHDFGWTVTGNSLGAMWERDVPVSELLFSNYDCNPSEDVGTDFGDKAFVTGNLGGDAATDGVLDGYTLLSSPMMDLTSYHDPVLRFTSWLCQRFIEEQSLFVMLSNGQDTITLDTILSSDIGGTWSPSPEIHLADLMPLTDQMQVHFLATESTDVDNVVKAGLDVFSITDAMPSGTSDISKRMADVVIYPNPAKEQFRIRLIKAMRGADALSVMDLFGREILQKEITGDIVTVDMPAGVVSGVYLVRITRKGVTLGVGKVIME